MRVKSCISTRNLLSLISSARLWYLRQYPETPLPVLHKYVQADYRVSDWVKARHYAYTIFYFLYCGQSIVGFMRLRPAKKGATCIEKIYLNPGFQGRGGGRMLIDSMLSGTVFLDVYAGNRAAISAFRKMGFECAGKIEFRDYGYRQSGFRMVRIREQKIKL